MMVYVVGVAIERLFGTFSFPRHCYLERPNGQVKSRSKSKLICPTSPIALHVNCLVFTCKVKPWSPEIIATRRQTSRCLQLMGICRSGSHLWVEKWWALQIDGHLSSLKRSAANSSSERPGPERVHWRQWGVVPEATMVLAVSTSSVGSRSISCSKEISLELASKCIEAFGSFL